MEKKRKCLGIHHDRWQKTGKIMKLCVMLVCLFSFSLSATTLAQRERVNMKLQEVSLKQVLEQIREQTKLQFMMSKEQGERVGQISVNVENETVEKVLNEIFAATDLTYVIREDIIVVKERLPQRQNPVRIRGIVKDGKGLPLPGVTVMVKGTSVGVVTDAGGNYSIELPDLKDIRLLFSFIGMKTQDVAYTGQKEIDITLHEEVTQMDEVVITGYQTIDRRKNTSAVTSVKAEDIMRPGVTSIDQMLEGQIPDLMFMSNSGEVGVVPKLRIRGTSTLIGNREPLWVVDGIVQQDPVNISPEELNNPDYINRIGNAIAGLNPQDIERLDILKDAAATALYGAKAANGVIVITTKKGHVGKPVITYNTNLSYKIRPRYTDRKIDLMNSKERIEFSKYLVNSNYRFPSTMNMVGYEGLAAKLYAGQITHNEFARQLQYLETLNTDWFDLLTEDAFSHQHTVSISGGSEQVRYYSSVGYAKDNDVIKGNNNERYTVALNLNADLSPRISTSLGINGNINSRSYTQDEIAPLDYAYKTSRAIPAYDEQGKYAYYQRSESSQNKYNFNILNEIENSSYEQEGTAFNFNLTLNAKFTDWLNASVIGSYGTSTTDIEGWWGEKSFHVAELRQSEYGTAPEKGKDSQSKLPFGGELNSKSYRSNNYMVRVQLNLNKYFGADERHNLTGGLGYEISSTKYKAMESTYRGYYKDRGKQFSQTPLDDYPAYKTWLEENAYPTIQDELTNLLSAYATLSYSYGNRFTVNANARIDGSNKFGDQSNDKLLPIWSVSANYNLSDHEWCSRDWIDFLTLKLSFGYQGNMLADQSPVMIIDKKPIDILYNELVSELAVYPNPNLRWEKTSSLNSGLAFSVLDRRVQIEGSYYYKRTKDAFLSKTISTVNGMSDYVVNSGTLTNSGFSIAATFIPVRVRDFSWILATSYSRVFNKMETLPGANEYELNNFLNGTALVKDKPVGTFYSYKFIGLNPKDGSPLFDDMRERQADLENLTKYDVYTTVLTPTGRREPTMSGNLNNTFTYRNWRLNMNLAYSLGSKVRLFQLFTSFMPEQNIRKEFVNHWQKPGDERHTNIPDPDCYSAHWSGSGSNTGKIPLIAYNNQDMYNYGDHRVVSGNYLKCSTLSLTYEFPSESLQRWKLSRLALNLSGTNLFTICSPKLKGQTPQQSGFANVELTDRPAYTFGLSISF